VLHPIKITDEEREAGNTEFMKKISVEKYLEKMTLDE
jgi:hypothetical protein